ncbi:L-xylulose reductase-like isoform X1 [Neodiprion pinetum]|uniref:L-xylulose reductase-like isoform X1 n=1 Tax=Neodiprion pinetum TaxID=441929 RepID=UPI001EE1354C|nr:L-xylulose reductase-like isoform X1 [Neodiprion pinetum]
MLNFRIEFIGKRIVVTGAGQGIGRALALRLSKFGGKVIAVSRTQKHLDTLFQEDPKIEIITADLADWESTRAAIEGVGRIDLLVNNAAAARLDRFLDVKPDDVDVLFNVNLKSVINVSQVAAKSMIATGNGGSIVNISSQASQAALKDHAVYCATKAALDQLTRVMALELGPHNIRVNAVNPTVVMTDMGRVGWNDPEKAASMTSKIPLGRFAEVDEVVDAVVYLLSNRSSMINGVTLPIDGGFLAT